MKFDVIIGNPPYDKGKDKMFYVNLISKAFSILKSEGIISFITPYSWVGKSLFNQMKRDGYFHHVKQENGNEIFKISMGSALCTFVYEKDSNVKGCADIEMHPNFSKDAIAQSIIGKIYENSIKPKKGKGQREFIHNRDEQHVFPIYLSSKNTENDNRTLMWSKTPGRGSNIDKLIVAHILEPGRASRFSEFSNEKGVGRYSQYFECTEIQSQNIKSFFDSKVYAFIDSNMRTGRYAFVELPNIDWSLEYTDDLIYSKLTQEEIEYIENAVK